MKQSDDLKKNIEDVSLSDDELEVVSGGTGNEEDYSTWKGYRVSHDLYWCPLCEQPNEWLDHLSDEYIDGKHIEVLQCQNCFGLYAYIS